MPKRSDREVFKGVFNGNPFEGLSPQEIYKIIQWGNNPNKVIEIDAPEAMTALGFLAKLYLTDGTVKLSKNKFYLALGADSNSLYIFQKNIRVIPDLDDNKWSTQGVKVKRTDYYSKKGGEDCYYYHNHEKPYPILFSHPKGVHILQPQKFKGQRSYAVIKEGIVG